MKTISKMTIGALAKEAGVGVETIRFYERKGLIKRPITPSKGYRQYQSDDIKKIFFIKRAQDLGFTLKEILDLLQLNTKLPNTCSDVKARADQKMSEIDKKISDLKRMKESLKKIASVCSDNRQPVIDCRVLDCFEPGWKC